MSDAWTLAIMEFFIVTLVLGKERQPRWYRLLIAITFGFAACLSALIALGVVHP